MAFTKKLIDVSFTLQKSTFAGSGLDTLTVKGLKVQARISHAGGIAYGTLQAQIFGLTLSQMNALSTLGMRFGEIPFNQIKLKAGDEKGMSLVFDGDISVAYADLNSAPDAAMIINAQIGLYNANRAADTISTIEGADIADVCQEIATKMKVKFENSRDVHKKISSGSSYFPGSLSDQLRRACFAADVDYTVKNGVLAIWPKNGYRETQSIPLVSRDTGMVGYPTYAAEGILVRNVFNPAIEFGKIIEVKSDIKPACGKWVVHDLDIALDSNVPNGNWFQTMRCYSLESGPILSTK